MEKGQNEPYFKNTPGLQETRDEILYLGVKSPGILVDRIVRLSKRSHDIIYEHAVLGYQFKQIAQSWYFATRTIQRIWAKAVVEYHDLYNKTEA